MHSYGGTVGTNALQDVSWTHRLQASLSGCVVQLIYLCSFLLPANESLAGSLGGMPPFIPENENGTCEMLDPGNRFYGDLPEDERQKWLDLLVASPTSTHKTPIAYTAYKDIPSTYISTERDQALPIEAQRMMVRRVQESGAAIDLRTIASDHSPFLGRAEEVAAMVCEVIASVVS